MLSQLIPPINPIVFIFQPHKFFQESQNLSSCPDREFPEFLKTCILCGTCPEALRTHFCRTYQQKEPELLPQQHRRILEYKIPFCSFQFLNIPSSRQSLYPCSILYSGRFRPANRLQRNRCYITSCRNRTTGKESNGCMKIRSKRLGQLLFVPFCKAGFLCGTWLPHA